MRNNNKMVSIAVLTYNHESFVSKTLDSILMQKCNFDYEIVIGEDCSTDNTRNKVIEYQNRYPSIIRLILHKKNIGGMANQFITLQACTGRYIALCEGDDYWIDENKLQKQYDYLEQNKDCSLCFHSTKIIRNNNSENYTIHKPKKIPMDKKYSIQHIILGGGGFMMTNSMFFNREYILELPKWMTESPVGDIPLMLLLALKGQVGFIDQVMSVYRANSSSNSWSSVMQDRIRRRNHHYRILKLWSDFDESTKYKYHKYVLIKKMKNRWGYLKENIIQLIK